MALISPTSFWNKAYMKQEKSTTNEQEKKKKEKEKSYFHLQDPTAQRYNKVPEKLALPGISALNVQCHTTPCTTIVLLLRLQSKTPSPV